MYFAVGSVLSVSIALGTSFYYYHEKWELSTCFYYACMVLNGNMFDTPSQENTDHEGEWFTLLFYIFGSSLMASAYGAFASVIVENSRKLASDIRHEVQDERRKSVVCMTAKSTRNLLAGMGASALALPLASATSCTYGSVEEGGGSMDTEGGEKGHRFSLWLHTSLTRKSSSMRDLTAAATAGTATGIYRHPPTRLTATLRQWPEWLLNVIGWHDHRTKYLTLVALCGWTAFGVIYGVVYERWDLLYAFRFSIATMSASGLPVPTCVEKEGYTGCQLGNRRAVFVGVYVLIGVPLFAFTLGQVGVAGSEGGGTSLLSFSSCYFLFVSPLLILLVASSTCH